MMKILFTASILGVLAAGSAYADCPKPDSSVNIPSGASATKDEMIAAQRALKAYDASVKSFGDCLQQEQAAKIAAAGDKASKSDKDKINAEYAKRVNDEIDKDQKLADKFNTELKAYKAKNTG